MTAPTKKAGWGSFLSQAVAGVESRLDTLLADNEEPPKDEKLAPAPATPAPPASPQKLSPVPSRAASSNRANDRLQERLARAMAAKAAAAGSKDTQSPKPGASSQASPRGSLEVSSRASTDSAAPQTPTSQEASLNGPSQELPPRESTTIGSADNNVASSGAEVQEDEKISQNGKVQEVSMDLLPPTVIVEVDRTDPMSTPADVSEVEITPGATTTNNTEKSGLEKELEDTQLQHQEEVHSYVERIDALEAKLQYLARETTDAARKAALEAPAGSVDKKLAEKDQQIAQLMEEGKNLASTEQKHRAIMKKLRSKIAEDEKELNSLKGNRDKSTREFETLRKQAGVANELEKANETLQRRLQQSQKELTTAKADRSSKDATITELRSKLQRATERGEAMSAKVNEQAKEQDRRRIKELEDSVATLEIEKNLAADRARAQINELKEQAERASERARALELEHKAEVQVMESKLEVVRTRAEEASSGATGDSQAKLLRQVETLQTQYSIASGNWQGIESTLLSRIANLEKERDEAVHRESDMRKKAREAALRAKRNEEELEEAKIKLPSIQDKEKTYQTQLDSLLKRAEKAEAALTETNAELDKQRSMSKDENSIAEEAEEKEEKQFRADQDRRGWLEDIPSTVFRTNSRPESPLLTQPQRTFSSDLLGLEGFQDSKSRKASAPSSNGRPGSGDRPHSRRPSAMPLARPSMQSGIAGYSSSSFSPMVDPLPTPISQQMDRDDDFDGVETPASPHQVMQDMVSVSTVAAGPSVQLVERMSAAIRRLESEKVAAREELARISSQRDEARAEIVALMSAAENAKTTELRVAELEKEVTDVNARYETTLELLGEKSELVEELRADVQDVKAMYRDLVERTVK